MKYYLVFMHGNELNYFNVFIGTDCVQGLGLVQYWYSNGKGILVFGLFWETLFPIDLKEIRLL